MVDVATEGLNLCHACSDGNIYRPLCKECDIELNGVVLWWMGFPGEEIEAKMAAYRAKMMRR